MIQEQTKLTVSFTVTAYNAALLIAAYDLLIHSSATNDDWSDVAPQTLDNYATLLGELLDRAAPLAEEADGYHEGVADSIRKFANARRAM